MADAAYGLLRFKPTSLLKNLENPSRIQAAKEIFEASHSLAFAKLLYRISYAASVRSETCRKYSCIR